ncbi:hypothetical protein FB566_0542 [Stackebrandtia endophytica]|uniref:Pyridoxamine 5'-phosphate oxidase n=1 Tax=Stackebrandtia endophytica TaxID=1496996 RepID=A0A543AR44_9ACTN|nr:pyridoxamine 5'-phosphate oxidase family protein [Stackebrandtia endophytica]TQL75050.1 hypothetical protein FB566_0542 [Stackebrandtia endophytica]
MVTDTWPKLIDAAAVCEVLWRTPDGSPHAIAATPLLWRDKPSLCFTYARADTARSIAGADSVTIVLSDPRLSGGAWGPVAITGRPHLTEDTSGDQFSGSLLLQELRKYPPSRALADSPLLRREHWWYVLRLIITVEPTWFTPVTPRQDGTGAVMATFGHGIQVATVTAPPEDRRVTPLMSLSRQPLPAPGPAVVLQHDFSVPDRELESSLVTTGDWDGELFTVTARRGAAQLPGPPGLLARMRSQYRLSRDCRRALADIG